MRNALARALIGREEELGAISGSLAAARAGAGTTLVAAGEPGVGKSRLAREASGEARRRGMTVLTGRAVDGQSPVAFRPLAEALLGGLRSRVLGEVPGLQPFLPALGRIVPEWRHLATHPQECDRSLPVMAEAVLRLLRSIAGDTGCLLMLEDLHWSDPETLAVVEYLADNISAEPMVFLVTMRDQPPTALELGRALEARRAAVMLELGRLDYPEVAAMARSCLGADDVPDDILALVQTRAEGLPLLVEELLAACLSSGALVRAEEQWRVAPDEITSVVPPNFAETIDTRLRAIGEQARAVVQMAAVLGAHFDSSLLGPATGLDDAAILEALRRGVERQLLAVDHAEGHPAFRLRHALTRDAVLATLLPPEREALCLRALEALDAAHPGLPGALCELAAELASAAGQRSRAAELLLEAGRRALGRSALGTAEAMLARGRELAADDAPLAADIDECRTEVLSLAGDTDRVAAIGDRLLGDLSRVPHSESRQVRIHLRISRAAIAASRWDLAGDSLRSARRLAVALGDPILDVRLDVLDAQIAIGENRSHDAIALAETALDGAELVRLPEVACEALEVIGRCARQHDLDAAEIAFERAHAIATEHELPLWRIRALHELGTIPLLRGGPLDHLLEARELALASGALATAAIIDLQLAAGHMQCFELAEMLDTGSRSAEAARRLHLDLVQGLALCMVAGAHALAGRRPDTEVAIAAALAVPGGEVEVAGRAWMMRALGSLVLEDRQRAVDELDRSMGFLRQTTNTAPFRGLWALLLVLEDRDGRAACEEVRSAVTLGYMAEGYLQCAEAVLLGRSGRRDEAAAMMASADAVLEGTLWFHDHARRLVAEAAINDGWGDPAAWLRAALAGFERSGHDRIASACRALLRQAGSPVPRRRAGSAAVPVAFRSLGITEREVEVMGLLAEGRTNREIGERLFLSPRTVERHVANLAAKVGVRRRAELAAFAARQAKDSSAVARSTM